MSIVAKIGSVLIHDAVLEYISQVGDNRSILVSITNNLPYSLKLLNKDIMDGAVGVNNLGLPEEIPANEEAVVGFEAPNAGGGIQVIFQYYIDHVFDGYYLLLSTYASNRNGPDSRTACIDAAYPTSDIEKLLGSNPDLTEFTNVYVKDLQAKQTKQYFKQSNSGFNCQYIADGSGPDGTHYKLTITASPYSGPG